VGSIKSYGGVSAPPFLYIEDVSYQVLPPIEIESLEVPAKAGAFYIDRKKGVRTFSASIAIKADYRENLLYYADDLAEWLDYDEPQPFILEDKPDHTYYAIVSGSSELDAFANTGKGKIDFVCYQPNAIGNEKSYTFAPPNTSPIIYTNGGNKTTYPIIDLTFTKNLTDFAIVTDDDALIFGDFDPTNDVAADLKPKYINDTGANTTGWTNGVSVDGGAVQGTLSSNGYSLQQASKDYGTGSLWHGAAMIKSIGKEVQDFECEASIGFQATDKKQIGRIELYALGVNGEKLGKIAMRDTSRNGDFPNFEAWAGAVGGNGVSVINSYGAYKGVWKQFNGVIRIKRQGKKWSFYIGMVDPATGRHHTRYSKDYTDWKQLYNQKVAAIQIHIAAYGTDAPVNEMWISNIMFKELLPKTAPKVDYVFRTGDRLRIDNEKGEILKNGERFYDELYPSSSFLKFDKGTNGLSVSDIGFKDGTLKFSERW
jgi:predicted phage tail component-like protein